MADRQRAREVCAPWGCPLAWRASSLALVAQDCMEPLLEVEPFSSSMLERNRRSSSVLDRCAPCCPARGTKKAHRWAIAQLGQQFLTTIRFPMLKCASSDTHHQVPEVPAGKKAQYRPGRSLEVQGQQSLLLLHRLCEWVKQEQRFCTCSPFGLF